MRGWTRCSSAMPRLHGCRRRCRRATSLADWPRVEGAMKIAAPAMLTPGEAAPFPDAAAIGWRTALPALVLAIVAILAIYWQTAESIEAIWSRSETFAHGYLIVPISLW